MSEPNRQPTLTWLGHASFRLSTATGMQIYFDPWLGNSDCPESEKSPSRVDVIVLSHGHFDHIGDTLALFERFQPIVVAPQDVRRWLEKRGLPRDDRYGPDMGGTVSAGGATISFTDARHSGGSPDGGYAGAPCGFVLRLPDAPSLYFAGDTCVFGDMALIGQLYRPDIAILPIGGHYTMDPEAAALALKLLGVRRCIPCHYRFGADPPPPRAILPGKPEHLAALVPPDVQIIAPQPGETLSLENIR